MHAFLSSLNNMFKCIAHTTREACSRHENYRVGMVGMVGVVDMVLS